MESTTEREELISIITPMYNAARYVRETMESVLAQSYTTWEHIIVDDGSVDGCGEIVKEVAGEDARVRLIRQENGGAAAARNRAIEEAQGRYLAFLDADDLWDSTFLECQLAFLQKHKADIVFSSYRMIDEERASFFKEVTAPSQVDYAEMLKFNPIGFLTSIIDRNQVGDVYFELGSVREDYVLWLTLLKQMKHAVGNPEVLASYRVHRNSISGQKWKMICPQYRVYRRTEGFSIGKSLYYIVHWGLHGMKKYYGKSK